MIRSGVDRGMRGTPRAEKGNIDEKEAWNEEDTLVPIWYSFEIKLPGFIFFPPPNPESFWSFEIMPQRPTYTSTHDLTPLSTRLQPA